VLWKHVSTEENPDIMPPNVPEFARPAVQRAIRDAALGGPATVVAQVPDLFDDPRRLEQIKTFVRDNAPPGVGLPAPQVGMICIAIVIVIAIVVMGVIFYVLWKACKLINHQQDDTNSVAVITQ
jgi:nitrogen fixation-related uncharacterized protein